MAKCSCLEKLVWLLIVSFLLCLQSCCGQFDSVLGRNPQLRANMTQDLGNCSLTQGLSCKEATALGDVLSGLGLTDLTVHRSFCPYTQFTENIDIIVNCSSLDNQQHIIIRLWISGLNSSGYLHKNVSQLEFLEELTISDSHLFGSIPKIKNLPSFRILSLTNNQLTGSIPDTIGSLTNLKYLDLGYNKFQGEIPANLGNIKSLTILNLEENLFNGNIPKELGQLTNLTSLSLTNNQLTGSIPDALGSLTNLTSLDLQENFLQGDISVLGELTSLISLDLGYNKFQGEIPANLGNITSLRYLHLEENLFNGNIPKELGQLTNLIYLYLTSNNLIGELPSTFSNLNRTLIVFEVAGNNLSGKIPKYIMDWKMLRYLNLLGNNFEGPLPPKFLSMQYLRKLWVSDLKNHTFVPFPLANLSWINSLILRNCLIEGPIPEIIGNWSRLDHIDLSFNKLNGTIPNSLSKLNLKDLYLTGNMLKGKIPDWIGGIKNKDLSFNNFNEDEVYPPPLDSFSPDSPSIIFSEQVALKHVLNFTDVPNQIVNEKTVKNWTGQCYKRPKNTTLAINCGGERVLNEGTYYDADESLLNHHISENGYWAYTCSGGVPREDYDNVLREDYDSSIYIRNITCGAANIRNFPLHKRSRFCPLNLTYYGFCLRKGSYKVKLYFSEIIYADDSDYSSLGKRMFDVYVQDKLVIPDLNIKERANGPNEEYIYTIKKVRVKDDHLLKISLVWAGKGSIYNPPLKFNNGPLISAIEVTQNFLGGLSKMEIALVSVVFALALYFVLALLWRLDLIGERTLRGKKFELDDESYSLKRIIAATGKFHVKNKIGTGHFGKLYKAELGGNKTYVVRKLDKKLMQQQGDRIIKEFYTLNHLKHDNLVRLFSGYSKGDLHLLIYEYVGANSLETVLFGQRDSTIQVLNWEDRVKVCKDIARGFVYLHEEAGFEIIHGDLKATNVFLYESDDSITAKISDYGLAKFNEEENPFSSTKDSRNLMYIAPEYASMAVITVKADVYSFGVLLLEILSGKRAVESEGNNQHILLYEANQLYREKKSKQLIDSRVEYEREEASAFVELAMKCTHRVPENRPKMSEVLNELNCGKANDHISIVANP